MQSCIWLLSLSIMPVKFILVGSSSYLSLVSFHCMTLSQITFLSYAWWMLGLVPEVGSANTMLGVFWVMFSDGYMCLLSGLCT